MKEAQMLSYIRVAECLGRTNVFLEGMNGRCISIFKISGLNVELSIVPFKKLDQYFEIFRQKYFFNIFHYPLPFFI